MGTVWPSSDCRGTIDWLTWNSQEGKYFFAFYFKHLNKFKIRSYHKVTTTASPFTHETLLNCGILCPWAVLPSQPPLCIDSGEQRDPGDGGVLPVDQTLLEGTPKLWASFGILKVNSQDCKETKIFRKPGEQLVFGKERKNPTGRLCGKEQYWALQCWLIPRAASWALGCSAQERDRGEVKRSRVFKLQSAGYCVHTGGAIEAGAIECGLWRNEKIIKDQYV